MLRDTLHRSRVAGDVLDGAVHARTIPYSVHTRCVTSLAPLHTYASRATSAASRCVLDDTLRQPRVTDRQLTSHHVTDSVLHTPNTCAILAERM